MADDVVLAIRIPEETRREFQIALKEKGTNTTEFLRKFIMETIKDRVPGPQKVDHVAEAKKYIKGDLPPSMSKFRDYGIPLVNEVERLGKPEYKGMVDMEQVAKDLAFALYRQSVYVMREAEKVRKIKASVEIAMKHLNNEEDDDM